MLHLYDRATMAHALTLDLDPRLHALLSERIGELGEELIDFTEYLVVEPGDTEDDIIRHVGFSPLINPIDRTRYPDPAFHPWWDYLADHGGWFELIVSFGGTFASIFLVQNINDTASTVAQLCRRYSPIRR